MTKIVRLNSSTPLVQASDSPSATPLLQLAEHIKSLKAGNSINATPERVRQSHSTAEEPITIRIRRRAETLHDSTTPNKPGEISWAVELPQGVVPDTSVKTPLTFKERSEIERNAKNRSRHCHESVANKYGNLPPQT